MTTKLDATIREGSGKGAARRTRTAGGVPAVVYGPGKPALTISVEPRALGKALTGPMRRNALLTLNVKDAAGKSTGSRTVLVKDLQAHPVKRIPTHVDFLEVDPNKPVAMKIPLEATGKAKAVADGGRTTLVIRAITVMVKPSEAPEKIPFDVSEMGFGVVRAKQLTLPAGITLAVSGDTPIISVKVPRQEKEEETAVVDAAATVPAAEGAKPAAGDAKAAAGAAAPAADAKKK